MAPIPISRDTQGYNALHLVTTLFLYNASFVSLLHRPISIDERDSARHTALMWAANQGDALSVECFSSRSESKQA